jgi:hypothetical protein
VAPRRAFFESIGTTGDGSLMTPRQTWESFWRFASKPLAVPRGEFDGLLYAYGLHVLGRRELFQVKFVRQVGTPGSPEYLKFHWDLEYLPTLELAALGAHHDRWFPECGYTRGDWRATVVAGDEWAVLDGLAPAQVRIYCEVP